MPRLLKSHMNSSQISDSMSPDNMQMKTRQQIIEEQLQVPYQPSPHEKTPSLRAQKFANASKSQNEPEQPQTQQNYLNNPPYSTYNNGPVQIQQQQIQQQIQQQDQVFRAQGELNGNAVTLMCPCCSANIQCETDLSVLQLGKSQNIQAQKQNTFQEPPNVLNGQNNYSPSKDRSPSQFLRFPKPLTTEQFGPVLKTLQNTDNIPGEVENVITSKMLTVQQAVQVLRFVQNENLRYEIACKGVENVFQLKQNLEEFCRAFQTRAVAYDFKKFVGPW
ncbi:Hypothetical_protein [Hexamita inflata]|uniref:Hypothetical_protein n=1 Tax=Hexamita inflata TaxID=28002 RepID=A0ABP1HLK5_9EUKA